jgi:tripartite-type tricarboxylate transporter receptor subunit TctC
LHKVLFEELGEVLNQDRSHHLRRAVLICDDIPASCLPYRTRQREATMGAGRICRFAFIATVLASYAGPAFPQAFPNKAIHIIAGFPPGGSVDAIARVVGEGLSKEMGQPVVVENKPGATGTLAANHVATSKPDGYTLLLVPGGHTLYGATFKSLPFDPVKSFDWICNIIVSPFFMVVTAESQFKSLSDVVAKAKANPGTVKFANAGPGSPHHLAAELLAISTGTKVVHVSYRGEGATTGALQGSEVDVGIYQPLLLLAQVEAGKLRALATTTNKRSSKFPQVPTVEEALKIKGYDIGSGFSVAGPAGMPPAVVSQLNAALRKVLALPETLTRLAPIGGDVVPNSPQEMTEIVTRQAANWAKVAESVGIEKQ